MSESIKHLTKVINDTIKSNSDDIQEYIKEITNPINNEDTEKIKSINDELTLTLKILKRSKMLKNKYKRIQSEINELSHYVYKPEEIDSDDELKWEREEMSGKIYTIKSNDMIEIQDEKEIEYETHSEDETYSEDEKDIEDEKFKEELTKTIMKNGMKYIGPKIIENMKKNKNFTIEIPIKLNLESKII